MRTHPALRPSSLIALAALAACGTDRGATAPEVEAVASPAAAGSAQPHLAAHGGTVLLSWLEPEADGGHALRYAAWEGEAWSAPSTIARGTDFFVNWADFPSVVPLPGGRVAAHWLQRSGAGTYAYDVRLALSADGGRSWTPPITPHRDGTQTEHGFVSLFPWTGDALGAIWLDGRNFAGREEGEGHHGGGPEMTLRHAAIGADGALSREELLDARVCDCCQTSAAVTARGPVVVYRDRSPGEVRDIAVIRHAEGRWTEPVPVHRDGWEIAGCPVNGPAVAASGERVAVAWFTAAADTPRVHLALSDDAGASFGAPVRIDDGDPLGRVDVLVLEDGSAVVTWMERSGEEAEVRMRRVAADGARGGGWAVAQTSAARASGFPRMARAADGILLAWTEPGEPSRVHTARVRLP